MYKLFKKNSNDDDDNEMSEADINHLLFLNTREWDVINGDEMK